PVFTSCGYQNQLAPKRLEYVDETLNPADCKAEWEIHPPLRKQDYIDKTLHTKALRIQIDPRHFAIYRPSEVNICLHQPLE
ncbi:MAG: hypothetical protein ACI9TH_002793, partial [Kiritimatiellia bacterium]